MRTPATTLVILAAICASQAGAQVRCGVAKDLVVQALENLKSSPGNSEIEDGVQLLKHAAQTCPTSGDAWYYRSLFEAKLGRKTQSDFALRQAKLTGSEAMDAQLDPFHLAAPADKTQVAAAGPVHEKWALVVGIGKFQKNIDMLAHTKKDAQDFADLLEDPQYGRFKPDHVKLLADKEATTANIKAGLNWIARSADAGDLVVFFVSSHGTARQQDSVGGLNYVVTHDTDPADEDKLYGSALPMIEISEIIRSRVKARRTAIFLDTCHSGGAHKGLIREVPPSPQMLDGMRAGAGRAIISSSQEDQSSYDSEEFENGIFTHFLLEALKQQNGRVSLSAVFDYVKQRVPKQAQAEQHAAQVPVMAKSEQGAEIILGVEAAAQARRKLQMIPVALPTGL